MNSDDIADILRALARREISPAQAQTLIAGPAPFRSPVDYDQPQLRDHLGTNPFDGREDTRVLLGVTHAALAVEAYVAAGGDLPVTVADLTVTAPVLLRPGGRGSITVERTGQRFAVRFHADGSDTEVAHGAYRPAQAAPPRVAVAATSGEPVGEDELYGSVSTRRGPALRALRAARIADGLVTGALARGPEDGDSTLPASLLDGVFVASMALLGGTTAGMWVPMLVEALTVYAVPGPSCHTEVRLVRAGARSAAVDAVLRDEDGRALVVVAGLTYRLIEDAVAGGTVGPGPGRARPEAPSTTAGGPAPAGLPVTAPTGDDLAGRVTAYLRAVVARETGIEELPATETFMSCGIDSTQLITLVRRIEDDLGVELYPTLFFEQQCLAELSAYFVAEHASVVGERLPVSAPPEPASSGSASSGSVPLEPASVRAAVPQPAPVRAAVSGPSAASRPSGLSGAVAVVGMAGRFAGASDVGGLWGNLVSGVDVVGEVPGGRWDWRLWFDVDRSVADRSYGRWGSFLSGVDRFDAEFFGVSPREAVWLDPQVRLLLEVAYEAFEDAGCAGRIRGTRTGVYVGTCFQDYWAEIVRNRVPLRDYQVTSSVVSAIAGRLSYAFDLQGPSVPVDNACASSLTALHLAVRALRAGECDTAVVAGVNLLLSPLHLITSARLGALSPTGRCRPFGAGADGYVPGEGVATLVLRPLERALADGDRIWAVVRGSATNHVGRSNSPTAPRPELQARVLTEAWADAGVSPGELGLLEAHGTGTLLGDPIEVRALRAAFGDEGRPGGCVLGSVKANLGHLEAAAGVAGVMRAILSLRNEMIPAMPGGGQLNPFLDLEGSPFLVNTEAVPWPAVEGSVRRAGISSFGVSGSNTHVVIEEPPRTPVPRRPEGGQLLVVSARTAERLTAHCGRLAEALRASRPHLADVAWTLQTGREAFAHRAAIWAETLDEAVAALDVLADGREPDGGWTGSVPDGAEPERVSVRPGDDPRRWAPAWAGGADVDWAPAWPTPHPPLAELPSYPFRPDRYPLPDGFGSRPDTPVQTAPSAGTAQPPVHLLEVTEEPLAVPAGPPPARLLLVAAAADLPAARAALDPTLAADLHRLEVPHLVDRCVEQGVDTVLCLLPTAVATIDNLEHAPLETAVRPLLGLVGELARRVGPAPARVVVVGHPDDPYAAALAGLGRSLRVAAPHLALTVAGIADADTTARVRAGAGLCAFRDLVEVRRVDGRWTRPGMREAQDTGERTALRDGAVVLVAGGLGGLGLAVAERLAVTHRARLVLTGRSPAAPDTDARLAALREAGAADAVYWPADLTDRAALTELVRRVRDRFGAVHAVVHSAGTLDGRGLPDKDWPDLRAVLAPKLVGLPLLDAVTADEPLDLFVVFSSASALLGDLGQGDYAVANRFADEFARWRERRRRPGRTVVVDWGLWRDGGMRLDGAEELYLRTAGLEYLDRRSGLDAFEEVLRRGLGRALVLAGPRASVDRVADLLTVADPAAADPDDTTRLYDDLRLLAAEVLETDPAHIQSHESLNDHGFDSISIRDLADRVGALLGVRLSATVFFTSGTLAGVVEHLRTTYPDAVAAHRAGQGPPPVPARAHAPGSHAVFGSAPTASPAPLPASPAEPAPAAVSASPAVPVSPAAPSPVSVVAAPPVGSAGVAEPIAVVGMAGVLPGAGDLDEFWAHLVAGRDQVTEVPPERWDWRSVFSTDPLAVGRTRSRWGGFLDGVDRFDAPFFRVSPREAELMDPQQRLLLQVAWSAVEDAGWRMSALAGRRVGVYVGAQFTDYHDLLRQAGVRRVQVGTGNVLNMLANRLSFTFDLRGPSETVDTACSSSLVAVDRAVAALHRGDCESAVVGGVSLMLDPYYYVLANEAGAFSPTGRCHSFDAAADGYVRGEGVLAVVLKPLSAAIRDGDQVHAVLRGSAVNHGGRASSLTAPNLEAQAEVVTTAWARAGVDPTTISYLEAHGTGTSLGDPIEYDGLRRAVDTWSRTTGRPVPDAPWCALGTVKTHIGHLEPAAGLAGLVTVALALRRGVLPGMLHQRSANPLLDLDTGPFRLHDRTTPWPTADGVPRRAGVSSFGFGGTNAHVVLEEARTAPPRVPSPSRPQVIVLSARDEPRLRAYAGRLAAALRATAPAAPPDLDALRQAVADLLGVAADDIDTGSTPADLALDAFARTALAARLGVAVGDIDPGRPLSELVPVDAPAPDARPALADVAFTLQTGREPMAQRIAVVTSDLDHLVEVLAAYASGGGPAGLRQGRADATDDLAEALVSGPAGRAYLAALVAQGEWRQLATLWTRGVDVDWAAAHQGAGRRVSLPTYPFEPQRHWFTDAPATPVEPTPEAVLPQLCTPVWTPAEEPEGVDSAPTGPVWIMHDADTARLAEALSAGRDARLVRADAERAPDDATEPTGVYLLCAPSGPVTPERVDSAQRDGVLALHRLVRTLDRRGLGGRPLWICVVTVGVCPVDDAVPAPLAAGLHALAGTVAREYPAWRVRVADLAAADVAAPPAVVSRLVDPARIPTSGPAGVAVLHRDRWYLRGFRPVQGVAVPDNPPVPRPGGVYVILGGAGGVGGVLAQHLAAAGSTVVLLGRGQLGDRQRQAIAEIDRRGGTGVYLRADADDPAALRAAKREIVERFGAVHGIVHSAIVLGDQTLRAMDEDAFRAVLAPKTRGSVAFCAEFADQPLDFVLFFSSVQSFVGNGGQGNYAAACAFQDAYGRHLRALGHPVTVLNWGYWGSVGVVADPAYRQRLAAEGVHSIEPPEGLATMRLALGAALPQLVAVRAEPAVLRDTLPTVAEPVLVPGVPAAGVPASGLDTDVPEPDHAALAVLAGGWQELERYCADLVAGLLRDAGLLPTPGTAVPVAQVRALATPGQVRLVDALLAALADAGRVRRDGDLLRPGPDAAERRLDDLPGRAADILARHPALTPYLRLLDAVWPRYRDLLAGRVTPQEALFPDGRDDLLAPVYAGDQVADHANALTAWAVARFVAAVPRDADRPVAVLEIGAGTGATTRRVLAAVDAAVEYHHTDVSAAFVRQGEQRFAGDPRVRCRQLDIEHDPAAQGFPVAGFDVVLAANVLHATADVAVTLGNAKRLLRPGGCLVVNEGTHDRLYATLTFGLLDGWWRHDDRDRRLPHSPLLDRDAWREALHGAGFEHVRSWDVVHQSVLAARSDGFVPLGVDRPAPTTPADVPAAPTPADVAAAPAARPDGVGDRVAAVFADVLGLDPDTLDREVAHTDLGVDSVVAIQVVNRLNHDLGVALHPTDMFSHPTITALTAHVTARHGAALRPPPKTPPVGTPAAGTPAPAPPPVTSPAPAVADPAPAAATPGPTADRPEIAVIGMSARFPDAPNLDRFWRNLVDGRSAVREVTRWPAEQFYDPDPRRTDRSYSRWGALLDDVDRFDPLFFAISPKEAERMDPQQRLLLEETWRAVEDAGYAREDLAGSRCGVYVGYNGNDYLRTVEATEPLSAHAFLGNSEAILAARLSYLWDLRGPCITVNTACSSSLTALHLAAEALRSGEVDTAVVAGVMVMNTPLFYHLASRAQMLSPTGACHTFDAAADGFVPGEGVGVVVLKRLDAALRDRDHVHAVVVGSGLNQDGQTNGITAPNGAAQTALETEVYDRFGVRPDRIGYVEAHGTGTRLGDPIEVAALTEAFRRHTDRTGFCAIGSVKTNIGHTLATAGMAGLIKLILCVREGMHVPSLNFREGNDLIGLPDTPFYVPTRAQPWHEPDGPRYGAVSAFGFSGTNAHVVVREAVEAAAPAEPSARPAYLVGLSGHTDRALRDRVGDLLRWLESRPTRPEIRDVAFTTLVGRAHHRRRAAWVVTDTGGLVDGLRSWLAGDPDGQPARPLPAETARRMCDASDPDLTDALTALAAGYRAGADPSWRRLFAAERCRRLPLPTYPFAGQRYGLDPAVTRSGVDDSAGHAASRADDGVHPMISALADPTGRPVTVDLTGAEFYVRDHVVAGTPTLPGAAVLELARVAGEMAAGAPVVGLRRITWTRAVTVDRPRVLHVGVTPTARPGVLDVAIRDPEEADGSGPYATGQVVVAPDEAGARPEAVDLHAVRGRCARRVDGADLYRSFADAGIRYGHTFQTIRALHCADDEVLAELALPDGTPTTGLRLHPCLLDGGMQAISGLFPAAAAWTAGPRIPFTIGRVEAHADTAHVRYAHVTPVAERSRFVVTLLDDSGTPLVTLGDVVLRPVGRKPVAEPPPRVPDEERLTEMLRRLHAGQAEVHEVKREWETLS
ncbi:SDR family NAD(P)-dependent oxidoreductase [Micromonospora sp. WMMD1120]|uniref:SDR family NAD(P)-dependent oxidoreductase n=1 Tax=Micromonospora sp. WMMD1120 TaxID=3016106 RepID=UPI0024173E38|nr:SDR family NAD(P)-dependent oxidoreductase [Micromonospora sp. WMMD1120]MDG4810843.1 SDR family NAD(P)-dependent oxidoreductase [Micromonospora sp. WMMD1120]